MVGKRKNLNAASKFMKSNIGRYQKRKDNQKKQLLTTDW